MNFADIYAGIFVESFCYVLCVKYLLDNDDNIKFNWIAETEERRESERVRYTRNHKGVCTIGGSIMIVYNQLFAQQPPPSHTNDGSQERRGTDIARYTKSKGDEHDGNACLEFMLEFFEPIEQQEKKKDKTTSLNDLLFIVFVST